MKIVNTVQIVLEMLLIWGGIAASLFGVIVHDEHYWVHGSIWFLIGAVASIVRRLP